MCCWFVMLHILLLFYFEIVDILYCFCFMIVCFVLFLFYNCCFILLQFYYCCFLLFLFNNCCCLNCFGFVGICFCVLCGYPVKPANWVRQVTESWKKHMIKKIECWFFKTLLTMSLVVQTRQILSLNGLSMEYAW